MTELQKAIRWVVELEPGVWLAPWDGDPGRTPDREAAKRFLRRSVAEEALKEARKHRDFKNAEIY